MRVRAFMKYGAMAASARQRLLQFLPYLRDAGVEVDVLPLFSDEHLVRLNQGRRSSRRATLASYGKRAAQLLTRAECDLLWIQYELFPYLPAAFESLIRLQRKPFVVDYDDAIFHQYDAHGSAVVRTLLGSKLETLWKRAAGCICGNEYLQERIQPLCSNTTIVPTIVDTDCYLPRPRSVEPPTVGWIGSPSTWRYVEPFLPLLRGLVERGAIRLLVVGGGVAADRHDWLESRAWSEAREVQDVQDMDIGIMPVPDDMWARGKCGYKLIQYMACGLPVVASPVGVNSTIVTEGVNGFLPGSDSEWSKALVDLANDATLRTRLGREGRNRAEERYSLASQAPRLLQFLRSSVG